MNVRPVPVSSPSVAFLVLQALAKAGAQLSLFGPRPAAAPVEVNHPPGHGWEPVPGTRHGGFRRRRASGQGYDYWYPSTVPPHTYQHEIQAHEPAPARDRAALEAALAQAYQHPHRTLKGWTLDEVAALADKASLFEVRAQSTGEHLLDRASATTSPVGGGPAPAEPIVTSLPHERRDAQPTVGMTVQHKGEPHLITEVIGTSRVQEGLSRGLPFDEGYTSRVKLRPLTAEERAERDRVQAERRAKQQALEERQRGAAAAADQTKDWLALSERMDPGSERLVADGRDERGYGLHVYEGTVQGHRAVRVAHDAHDDWRSEVRVPPDSPLANAEETKILARVQEQGLAPYDYEAHKLFERDQRPHMVAARAAGLARYEQIQQEKVEQDRELVRRAQRIHADGVVTPEEARYFAPHLSRAPMIDHHAGTPEERQRLRAVAGELARHAKEIPAAEHPIDLHARHVLRRLEARPSFAGPDFPVEDLSRGSPDPVQYDALSSLREKVVARGGDPVALAQIDQHLRGLEAREMKPASARALVEQASVRALDRVRLRRFMEADADGFKKLPKKVQAAIEAVAAGGVSPLAPTPSTPSPAPVVPPKPVAPPPPPPPPPPPRPAIPAYVSPSAKLPKLKGSDKQIRWAESIRSTALSALEREMQAAHAAHHKDPTDRAARGRLERLAVTHSLVGSTADVRPLIDNRDLIQHGFPVDVGPETKEKHLRRPEVQEIGRASCRERV